MSTNNARPALTPTRKPVDPKAAEKFITGATEHLSPHAAPEAAPIPTEPLVAAKASTSTPSLPIEQLVLTIPAKRDHIHYADKGKSWPFRLTESQRSIIEFTLEHSKFKSAQQMFEVFFIGGLECYANQLAEGNANMQESLKEILRNE